MSKFIKLGNTLLNLEQIECVTENNEIVGYEKEDGSPFSSEIREIKGIQVHMINSSDGNYYVFRSETLESFMSKVEAT